MNESAQQTMLKFLEITAKAAGFADPKTVPEIVGAIINTFLSLLGIIFLILIIYGGFVWMTAGGNELKVFKAKRILAQAVIGILIIMSAYSITYFVIHNIVTATY